MASYPEREGPSTSETRYAYPEDRPIALSIEDWHPCGRCGQTMQAVEKHRCVARPCTACAGDGWWPEQDEPGGEVFRVTCSRCGGSGVEPDHKDG